MNLNVYVIFFKLLLKVVLLIFMLLPLLVQAKSRNGSENHTLTVITSFSHQYTNEFRRHFTNKYPDMKIKFIKMKTSEAIEYLERTKNKNIADLFMASSPEVFEVMKKKDLFQAYNPKSSGIPEKVSAFPINEKWNFYSGFALSATGLMWNLRYLDAKSLPAPENWKDLIKADYRGHVAMSSPSRSSTTHIIVESILQNHGWYAGWAMLKKIGGNLKVVTKKSSDVPHGVKHGDYGVGLVIDYYGLVAKAREFPVSFGYPDNPHFLPANIGIIKNAPNKENATTFMNFLLSDEGQNILIGKNIQRLPVLPSVYNNAPDAFPNPFKYKRVGNLSRNKRAYNLELSKQRYNLVNSLFDNMITFNLDSLRGCTRSLHHLSYQLKNSPNVDPIILLKARLLLERAERELIMMPVAERKTRDDEFLSVFKKKRKKKSDPLSDEQEVIEMDWNIDIQEQYNRVQELAGQGLEMLENARISALD